MREQSEVTGQKSGDVPASVRTEDAPAWAMEGFLEVNNAGHLAVEDVDALELVRDYGTPLYVFSEPRIVANIESLKRAASAVNRPVKFCYASKANSNMAVLDAVRRAGIDAEVNSGGELYKALRVGFRPHQIIFNGTSKTTAEIDHAVGAGIYAVNVDSLYELELIEASARRLNKRARVALRLVPEIGTRSHIGLQTALLTSKFGIAAVDLPHALQRAAQNTELLDVCGIHIHVGSQTPDIEPFADACRVLWQHLIAYHQLTGKSFDHINIGGGLPVNYLRDASHASDIAETERLMFSAQLDTTEVLRRAVEVARGAAIEADALHLFEGMTILMEPGRSVISDTGIVLTTVRNEKTREGVGDTWVLTDAGYNLLLSMNNYKWYYHLVSASRAGENHDTPYKVAGPLCDSGDVYFDIEQGRRLPDYRKLPKDVRPGEVLALLNAGAYSLAQMFPYNGRPLPAAVMVRAGGRVDVIRRADTYEDLVAQDVW